MIKNPLRQHLSRDASAMGIDPYKHRESGADVFFGDGHVAPAGNGKDIKFRYFF